MKIIKQSIAALAVLTIACGAEQGVASTITPITPDPNIENKVAEILKEMTLDEKIGQMTQLTLSAVIDKQRGKAPQRGSSVKLNMSKVDTVLRRYKVGSILNTPGIPLPPDKWSEVINIFQEIAIQESGIPIMYGLDQNHGTTYTDGGTMLPQPIAMAASFNPELVYEGARMTAYETSAGSTKWSFSPVLDLGRDSRWSRQWEGFGEDSYLASRMGVEVVRGYQGGDPNHIGRDNIAACIKHYMGYGVPHSGKDRTPAYISESDLREKHFQPFVDGIRAGALSVMVNSGIINGLPCHANKELITEWLKRDLNWDGMVVSDWADIDNLYKRDKICANEKEAIKIAINAGIDMSMVPTNVSFCRKLKELVEEGEVPMSRIDDAVSRVLRMKMRLGLFDEPYCVVKSTKDEYPRFAAKEHAQLSLQSAEEAITLLKNRGGVLPIKRGDKLLITGPNANSMRALNGGWSMSWQGEAANEYCSSERTIVEAFIAEAGERNIIFEPGLTYKEGQGFDKYSKVDIKSAVAAARHADYILLCLGENSYCETPGNIDDLTISAEQIELAKALSKCGKPMILVLTEGRPRVIREIVPLCSAVVHCYLPGSYGGDALANIIYGDVNPSGKLPYTYPKYVNSLTTYDHKPSEKREKMEGDYNYDAVISVQWAFGYGLSYTEFSYSNLKIERKNFKMGDKINISVDVTNSGERIGKESVLLFINDDVASLTPDVRRLRAFKKVEIRAGECRTVEFEIDAKELAFVGYDGKWRVESGRFTVQVASLSDHLNCTESYIWESPNR